MSDCIKCGAELDEMHRYCPACHADRDASELAPARGSAHWQDEHDWPCDNYQYQNRCVMCAIVFTGDKRRAVCRKCSKAGESLPPLNAPNKQICNSDQMPNERK